MEKIRYMIVDDQQIVREGLAGMLGRERDLELVGVAKDGRQAVTLAVELKPDLILMDLRLPEMSGAQATAAIRQLEPQIRVIILTVYDDDEEILEGLRAGAKALLLKDISREELISVIHTVAEGKVHLQPELSHILLEHLMELPAPGMQPRHITRRELDVLQLLARGYSNKEIAIQLAISEHTVKSHVTNILSKLEARDRAEAVAKAIQKGVIQV